MKALSTLLSTLNVISNHIMSINKFIVKSDEEDLEMLLKNDDDRIAFQKKVDNMLRENKKSDTVKINDRIVTISL
ncbi:hypothetical protein [Chryseobacterium wanjuense]